MTNKLLVYFFILAMFQSVALADHLGIEYGFSTENSRHFSINYFTKYYVYGGLQGQIYNPNEFGWVVIPKPFIGISRPIYRDIQVFLEAGGIYLRNLHGEAGVSANVVDNLFLKLGYGNNFQYTDRKLSWAEGSDVKVDNSYYFLSFEYQFK